MQSLVRGLILCVTTKTQHREINKSQKKKKCRRRCEHSPSSCILHSHPCHNTLREASLQTPLATAWVPWKTATSTAGAGGSHTLTASPLRSPQRDRVAAAEAAAGSTRPGYLPPHPFHLPAQTPGDLFSLETNSLHSKALSQGLRLDQSTPVYTVLFGTRTAVKRGRSVL